MEIFERQMRIGLQRAQTSGCSDSVACPQIRDGSALWRMPTHELVLALRLKPRMSCPHCLKKFSFRQVLRPRNQWAYRVIGPFTTGASLAEHIRRCGIEFPNREGGSGFDWVPSFTMRNPAGKEFEADLGCWLSQAGLAIRPRRI